jgi:hypothetical protein
MLPSIEDHQDAVVQSAAIEVRLELLQAPGQGIGLVIASDLDLDRLALPLGRAALLGQRAGRLVGFDQSQRVDTETPARVELAGVPGPFGRQ